MAPHLLLLFFHKIWIELCTCEVFVVSFHKIWIELSTFPFSWLLFDCSVRWCLVLKFREEVKGKHLQPSRRPQLLVEMVVGRPSDTKRFFPREMMCNCEFPPCHGWSPLQALQDDGASKMDAQVGVEWNKSCPHVAFCCCSREQLC